MDAKQEQIWRMVTIKDKELLWSGLMTYENAQKNAEMFEKQPAWVQIDESEAFNKKVLL